jgi:Skp family chaperone for outer membrane proteins
MNWTEPLITGALLALFSGLQAWINKGRFDAIDRRFEQVDRRFEQVDRRFEQVGAELAQLRSDLLQVVLALKPQRETG